MADSARLVRTRVTVYAAQINEQLSCERSLVALGLLKDDGICLALLFPVLLNFSSYNRLGLK